MGVATAARPIDFEALLDFCKSESPEKGDFILEGYVATSDLDLQGDVILPEALKAAAKDLEKNSTVLDNHDPNKRVGAVLLSEARPGGLFVRIRISETVPHIRKQIEEGVVNKFSIRGKVIDAEQRYDADAKRVITIIKKMYLIHCSVVSTPANTEARSLRHYIVKALEVSSMENEPKKEEVRGTEGQEPQIEKQAEKTPEDPKPNEATPPAAEPKPGEKPAEAVAEPKPEEVKKEDLPAEPAVEEVKTEDLVTKAELSAEGFKRISGLLDTVKAATTDAKALAAIQTIKAILGRVSGAATGYPYPAPAQKAEGTPAPAVNPEVEKTLGEVVEAITKMMGVMVEIKDSVPRLGLRKSHIEVGGGKGPENAEADKDIHTRVREALDEAIPGDVN